MLKDVGADLMQAGTAIYKCSRMCVHVTSTAYLVHGIVGSRKWKLIIDLPLKTYKVSNQSVLNYIFTLIFYLSDLIQHALINEHILFIL